MRKPRDYDAELKVLDDKARDLKRRKVKQLGELVATTGADALPVEIIAGALLTAVETKDQTQREAWRKRGDAFFRAGAHPRDSAGASTGGSAANKGSAPSPPASDGAA